MVIAAKRGRFHPEVVIMPAPASSPDSPVVKIAVHQSLRVRLLLVVSLFVVTATVLLEAYTLDQFRAATTFEIEHEGRLLSDLLVGALEPHLIAEDFGAMQDYIDRIGDVRDKNDIEINVMLDRGGWSEVVVSNVPDNIEATDDDEHDYLLESIARDEPLVVISQPQMDDDPDDIEDIDESHPDFHIPNEHRIMEITTPLYDGAGVGVGAIIVKSSLANVDVALDRFAAIIIIAAGLEVLVVVLGLGLLLDHQLFRPLMRLNVGMAQVSQGDLENELTTANPHNEIGLMAQTFNAMARQLGAARRQLHMYLNPQAIDEAYRRAQAPDKTPLAVERVITILFVDVVSFTTRAEELGPHRTVALLNRFHDVIAAALVDSQGYVDKFVADEAVGIFDTPGHASHAVAAAERILRELKIRFTDPPLEVRIGINTGPCIVADIGSESQGRLDRTVIGDTVNVAQRLMAKAAPGQALLSKATRDASGLALENLVEKGELALKGRSQTVVGYALTQP